MILEMVIAIVKALIFHLQAHLWYAIGRILFTEAYVVSSSSFAPGI